MNAPELKPVKEEYSLLGLVVETLKELGAVFIVDGELIEPDAEETQEGEE